MDKRTSSYAGLLNFAAVRVRFNSGYINVNLLHRKLVFYQSREDTGYAGEATIKRIVISGDPFAFFDTFGDAVFLTREEATAYARGQGRWQGVRVRKGETRKRPWIALELEDIRVFDRIKKPGWFVPVGGRHLRE